MSGAGQGPALQQQQWDEFQRELDGLVGDQSLEHFKCEHEQLQAALHRSQASETRLISKCKELMGVISGNVSKVQTALKLSQGDQATIAALKKVRPQQQPPNRVVLN